MASKHAQDLRRRIDVASENLSRQLQGMDAHMERADAPGEWTTREVLSHLLFDPDFDPSAPCSPVTGTPTRASSRKSGRPSASAATPPRNPAGWALSTSWPAPAGSYRLRLTSRPDPSRTRPRCPSGPS